MTPEVYAALISLLLGAITALGWFVRLIGIRLQASIAAAKKAADEAVLAAAASTEAIAENTEITRAVEAQTNGALQKARNQAQKALAAYDRAARVGREQRWLIQEIQRTAEGREMIDRIMQRRRAIIHDSDYDDLTERLLQEARHHD